MNQLCGINIGSSATLRNYKIVFCKFMNDLLHNQNQESEILRTTTSTER